MQDMNDHRHLVVDAAVAVMVVETDEIDPEIADDLEVQEEVDHEADQIDEAVAEIEVEIVEVDLIVDRTVTDQTVVAVTNQQANQDLAQDPDPPPDKKFSNCPSLSDAKV